MATAKLVFCCIAAMIASNMVVADDKVDETKAVIPTGIVEIHNPRGDLEVHGWDKAEVRVEGELDDLARGFRFEVDGEHTVIGVRMPRKNVNWGDGSDLVVYVPAVCDLRIGGVSADVDVTGVIGSVGVRSVSGDVDVAEIGSKTQIKTVSGDVEVSGGSGALSVTTSSGDIQVDAEVTMVLVDTVSGDVELRLDQFDRLRVGSVNGSLEIEGGVKPDGQVALETVNADIELELREPVNAQISARTVANGSIENGLSADEPVSTNSRQWVLNSTVGDGSSIVQLNTVNGSIELE